MLGTSVRPILVLSFHLVLIITFSAVLTLLYMTQGLSATWLFTALVTLLLCANVVATLVKYNSQLFQVIKALANGDSSLGFANTEQMKHYYLQVKEQMQAAQLKAERQSQFLKTLLIHIDLAVIVCDDKHHIIEANPAVARLLGTKIREVGQLQHISSLILNANKNFSSTVQWLHGERQDTLSMRVSLAHIQGQALKIITLQSIHDTLLNKEQQAYKRLTQVLTHEVANTITPLASIAQTCHGLLPNGLSFDNEQVKSNMDLALSTLSSRTQYLGEFITRFRQVSSLPNPNLAPASLEPLLHNVHQLHKQQLLQAKVNLTMDVQTNDLVMLDKAQIEQVLINLIKNSIEVLTNEQLQTEQEGAGEIKLVVGKNAAQQLYLDVIDNGAGVSEQALEMIFVPFYTTKQQGSGIGLSLSKQIMINHGGDLVYIAKDNGACFRCVFG